MMKLLSICEPLGAIAVLSGFLMQPATLGLGIIMIGAITLKIKSWKTPFTAQDKTGWEFDFIILAVCVALYFTGAGAFGLDRLIFGL